MTHVSELSIKNLQYLMINMPVPVEQKTVFKLPQMLWLHFKNKNQGTKCLTSDDACAAPEWGCIEKTKGRQGTACLSLVCQWQEMLVSDVQLAVPDFDEKTNHIVPVSCPLGLKGSFKKEQIIHKSPISF